MTASRLHQFMETHLPALQADEVTHNIMIAVLREAASGTGEGPQLWSLATPGHCAIQSSHRPLLLGALDEAGCFEMAALTRSVAYSGVVGPEPQIGYFVRAAQALGIALEPSKSMRLHTLEASPRFPGSPGSARPARPEDASLIYAWLNAFREEATPHDPAPTPEGATRAATSGRFRFWTVDGEPVAMATCARMLSRSASINAVYTQPALRQRGYAGSVVATVCEAIFADCKQAATLYTDLSNPASNRCYAKIGFEPHSDFAHFIRNG